MKKQRETNKSKILKSIFQKKKDKKRKEKKRFSLSDTPESTSEPEERGI